MWGNIILSVILYLLISKAIYVKIEEYSLYDYDGSKIVYGLLPFCIIGIVIIWGIEYILDV